MNIKQIFDEIKNQSGDNMKMDILRKYSNDKLLEKVLYLANSKRVKYYIKQIPAYSHNGKNIDLSVALTELEKISSRQLTGSDAKTHLVNILCSVDPDDAYIIERIIEKDCKVGMGTTNMNKVFASLIEKTPYMGAKSHSQKLAEAIIKTKRAVSQTKMDGRYANSIIRDGDVYMESRSGEQNYLNGAQFIDELTRFDDCVLNGEYTIVGRTRYDSNGLIASLITIGKKIVDGEDVTKEIAKFEKENNIQYQEALDSIVYTVWDCITVDEYFRGSSKTAYNNRLGNLGAMLHHYPCDKVQLIESVYVNTYAEALKDFQHKLSLGLEGTILKSLDGEWKDGKPNWQVKLKKVDNFDLKIVGFNYGTKGSKNEHLISSLNVESECGLLKTSPGGIDEKTMKYITANQDALIGTIVEVKCNGLSFDTNGSYALLHPVFDSIRDDKKVANTLEECKKISEANL